MEHARLQQLTVPDVLLTGIDEQTVALADLWHRQPVLLYFMRHLGCALCRAHLRQLVDAYPRFQQRGMQVAAITFADPVSGTFLKQTQLVPFPIFCDLPRKIYRAFGMVEGTLADVMNPSIIMKQFQLIPQGFLPSISPGANIRQLGGSVIIDTNGAIRMHHLAHPIDRYPTIDQYLAALD